MHRFESSVVLPATPEDVFEFHQNPENIREISPWFLRVIRVVAHAKAVPEETFELKLRVFGIPFAWKGTWAVVQNPSKLVDTAELFPFQKWRHEHEFIAVSSGTKMIDRVTYQISGGNLGKIAGSTFFQLQMFLMFNTRHRATKAYFSVK